MGNLQSSHDTESNARVLGAEEPGAKFRKLAEEEALKRNKCYEESQNAYRSGQGRNAKSLSEEGKQHAAQMEEYNRRAADEIFAFYNPDGDLAKCDLHGLFVQEALERAQIHITKCKRAHIKETMLITGRGNRSKDGIAKIKPAIEDMLVREKLRATMKASNPGVIYVELDVTEGPFGWVADHCVIL